eukprot:139449-Prorocentrum_minimum.AAC.10
MTAFFIALPGRATPPPLPGALALFPFPSPSGVFSPVAFAPCSGRDACLCVNAGPVRAPNWCRLDAAPAECSGLFSGATLCFVGFKRWLIERSLRQEIATPRSVQSQRKLPREATMSSPGPVETR